MDAPLLLLLLLLLALAVLTPSVPIGSSARVLEVVFPPGAKANDTLITPSPPPKEVMAEGVAILGVGPKVRSVKAHQAVYTSARAEFCVSRVTLLASLVWGELAA